MSEKVVSRTKFVSGEIRMSYANLFVARAMVEGQDEKYSLCVLVPKKVNGAVNPDLVKIKACVDAAKEEGAAKWGGKIPPMLKLPLRDGDVERPDDEAYVGHYFFNASSKQKPGVIDRLCNDVIDPTEVYSGCYGRVSVNFYPYAVGGSKGVAAGLQNVQKLRDGASFGGRSRATDDFGVADSAEDDFLS